MSAAERVINDLNVAKLILCNPQMLSHEMRIRIGQAISDTIALLKEKEPKKAKKVVEEYGWLFGDCPSCGSRLNNKDYPKACGKCGQALEWDDEDGHKYEDKKCYVWKGEIFRRTSANYLGCEVHLEQEPLGNWIEISKAQLAEYFSPKDGDEK